MNPTHSEALATASTTPRIDALLQGFLARMEAIDAELLGSEAVPLPTSESIVNYSPEQHALIAQQARHVEAARQAECAGDESAMNLAWRAFLQANCRFVRSLCELP